jgi:hypothetical protein
MPADASGPLFGVLLGAVVAALGYLGKLAIEGWQEWRSRRAMHRARLYRLQALLRAGRVAFRTQRDLAGRLAEMLMAKSPGGTADDGLESLFVVSYPDFDPAEAALHGVIRSYTRYALLPLNRELADWLRADVEDRVYRGADAGRANLASLLNELDTHLLLWLAKYEGWIPDREDHALVYLVDEERHGPGFPQGVEEALDAILAHES